MGKNRRRDDSMDIDQAQGSSPPSTAYGSPSYSPPELEKCTDEREALKRDYQEAEEDSDESRVARLKAKGKAKASSPDEDDDSDDEEQRAARRKAKGKAKASSPDEDDDSEDEEQRAARRKAKGKAKASSPSESDNADDEQEIAARRKAKGKARAYPPPDENYNDDYDDENRPTNPPFAARLNPLASHPMTTTAAAAEEDTSMTGIDHYYAGHGYSHKTHFGDADAAMNETLFSPSSPHSENDSFTPSATRNPLSERRGHGSFPPLVARDSAEKHAAMMQGDGGWGRGRGRGRGQGWGLAWRETVSQETVDRGGWRVYEDPHPSPTMQLVGEGEEEQEEQEEMGWEVYDPSAWERASEGVPEQEAGRVTLKVPMPSSSSSSVARVGGEGSSSARPTTALDTNVNYELLATHSGGGGGGGEFVRAVRSYKAILTGNFLSYEKDEVLKVIYRDVDGKLFTLLPLKDRASSGRAHTRNFVPAAAGYVPGDGKSGGVRGERKGG